MEAIELRRARTIFLVLVGLLVALAGAYQGLFPDSTGASAMFWLGVGLVSMFVVNADSRIVGKPVPGTAGWLVLMFWPVAVPAYAISTRGWRGLLFAVGSFLILLLMFGLAAGVARWLSV